MLLFCGSGGRLTGGGPLAVCCLQASRHLSLAALLDSGDLSVTRTCEAEVLSCVVTLGEVLHVPNDWF